MKKLNFFALMAFISVPSFAMQKAYYQADFLKGIESQFNATGNFIGARANASKN
jgi:hypothetical protein